MWRWLRTRRPPEPNPWPVRLTGQTPTGVPLVLRPLRRSDERAYRAVRWRNREWLEPWDATSPHAARAWESFADLVGHLDAEARAGRSLPLAMQVRGEFVGQLTVSIVRGSFQSGAMGYWIAREFAGQGLTPTAVALVGDHCFQVVGLHRLEINIRPENTASLAVVRKLGLRDEGRRERYLHIAGAWRDHRSFAVTVEELGRGSLMDRLTQQSQQSLWRHTEGAAAD